MSEERQSTEQWEMMGMNPGGSVAAPLGSLATSLPPLQPLGSAMASYELWEVTPEIWNCGV